MVEAHRFDHVLTAIDALLLDIHGQDGRQCSGEQRHSQHQYQSHHHRWLYIPSIHRLFNPFLCSISSVVSSPFVRHSIVPHRAYSRTSTENSARRTFSIYKVFLSVPVHETTFHLFRLSVFFRTGQDNFSVASSFISVYVLRFMFPISHSLRVYKSQ